MTKWVDKFPRSLEMMRNTGCFPLCERMQGHNVQVTKDFIKNWKDSVVHFETLNIGVDEITISESIGVP